MLSIVPHMCMVPIAGLKVKESDRSSILLFFFFRRQ